MLLKTIMAALAATSLLLSGSVLAGSKVVLTSMLQGGVLDASSYLEEGQIANEGVAMFKPVLHPSGEYVYGFGMGGVGKIDLNSYQVSLVFDRSVYSGYRELLVHPNGELLYIVGDFGIDVVDTIAYNTVATIEMPGIKQAAISRDGGQLYINQTAGPQRFIKLNSMTLAVEEEVNFSGKNTISYTFENGMPLDSSGNYAVVYAEGSTIRGINTSTYELLPVINTSSEVSQLLLVGDAIYMNDQSNIIKVYGIADGVLRATIDVGYEVVGGMAYDEEHQIVHVAGFEPSEGSVSSIDVNSYLIINTGVAYSQVTGMVIKPSAVDLALQIQRMTPFVVQCSNDTTGQVVTFAPKEGETVYNCEANGLIVAAGDQVTVAARGNAQ